MYNYIPLEQAADILDSYRKPVNSKERLNLIKGKPLDELFPYYGATGQVGWIDSFLTDGEYILLGEDGAPFLNPYAEKAYIIYGKTWVNNHAHILRSKTNNEFLCYYLNYFNYKNYVSGTTRLKLTQAQMRKIPIPNIPSDEQSRIVAHIEELFSELDKAVGTLKTIKEQLDVYRQAVLVDIFSQEHPLRQLKEISVALSGFAFKSKNYTPDGKYTVIKIGNVKDGYLDFSRDKTRTNEVTDRILQKYLLKQGDCLITLTGTRGKRDYGFVSMIERQTDYLLNQRVAALRFDTMIALPEFFRYYLSSLNYRNQFFKYETGNVGQGNVGIKALCEPAVPCPPLDTQKKIVDQISDRLSVCDSIEKTVDTALAQADAMRQSILKQAFEEGIV